MSDHIQDKFLTGSVKRGRTQIEVQDRSFECDVCRRKFRRADLLTRHKTRHTEDIRSECDVCKKRFKRSDTLTRHKRTHIRVCAHECDVCNKRFTASSCLIRHKKHTHWRQAL